MQNYDNVKTDAGMTTYTLGGKLHNITGPAIESSYGNLWFLNGKLLSKRAHEETVRKMMQDVMTNNKNARQFAISMGAPKQLENYDDVGYTWNIQIYTLRGQYHRTDGPAYIDVDTSRNKYYLYGKFYMEKDYDAEIKRLTALLEEPEIPETKPETVETISVKPKKYRLLLDGVEYSADVIEYL